MATEHFTVDLSAKRVTKDNADVRLTPTEWQLPEVLVRPPDRLVTQRQLLAEVWVPATRTRPTTCGCTWPICVSSGSPTRPGRGTC